MNSIVDKLVRLATSDDVEEVCRLVQQMTPGSPHDYKDAIKKFESHIEPSPDYYLWVAEYKGKIVGTAMMHLQHKLSYKCGTAAHLEDVVVDKDSRGFGIGKALVLKAIRTAQEHECYKIMLTCLPKTIDYYSQFAFEVHDVGMKINLKDKLYD